MINRSYIRAKLDCMFNQAKVRGLTISNGGWGVEVNRATGRYELTPFGPGHKSIYILALLIEGRLDKGWHGQNIAAARVLGLTSDQMQMFSNGFCSGSPLSSIENNAHPDDDGSFLHTLGRYYKGLLK